MEVLNVEEKKDQRVYLIIAENSSYLRKDVNLNSKNSMSSK